MENMQGSVSINTENIFPIIKKWYFDVVALKGNKCE